MQLRLSELRITNEPERCVALVVRFVWYDLALSGDRGWWYGGGCALLIVRVQDLPLLIFSLAL